MACSATVGEQRPCPGRHASHPTRWHWAGTIRSCNCPVLLVGWGGWGQAGTRLGVLLQATADEGAREERPLASGPGETRFLCPAVARTCFVCVCPLVSRQFCTGATTAEGPRGSPRSLPRLSLHSDRWRLPQPSACLPPHPQLPTRLKPPSKECLVTQPT